MATTRATYEEAIKKGDALAWQGRWEESLAIFQQALAETPGDVLSHSSVGAAYTHLGKFEEALEEYRQVMKALPQDVLTLARVADCYAKLGRMAECAATYLLLGDVYVQQRNYLRATAAWRKLISLLPEHEEARIKLAEALDRGGDVEEAAEQYAALASIVNKKDRERGERLAWKALELDSNNAEAKRLLGTDRTGEGHALHQAERPLSVQPSSGSAGMDELPIEEEQDKARLERKIEGAEAQPVGESREPAEKTREVAAPSPLRPAFDELPEDLEAKLRAALDSSEKLMAQGLYLAALDDCYQALDLSPTYLPVHLKIGEIQAARGRVDEAVEKYAVLADVHLAHGNIHDAVSMRRRIMALRPKDFEGRASFVRLLLQAGKADEALEQQLLLAESRSQAQQFDRAVADFEEAIRIAPGNVQLHLRSARMLSEMGRTDDAMREYEEAAALDPNNVEAMLRLSIANRLSGDSEGAHKHASKLIEAVKGDSSEAENASREYLVAAKEHPDIPDFSAWAGLLLCTLGKMAEATPYLEQAIEGAIEVEAVRIGLCRCYLARGMHAKAVALLDQISADRAAEFRPAFRQEADRLGREGHWDDAAALLEILKRGDPQDDGVYVKLAEAYFRQGNAAGAVREFDSLGQLYLARGQKKRAIAIFQVMKQLAPKTALPYARLGDTFASEGMKKEAIAEYEVLADLQLKQEQIPSGIAALRRIIQLDPDGVRGYRLLGEALFTAKEYTEAAKVLRRLLELDPTDMAAQSQLTIIKRASGG